jgi:hypothetical protein
MKKIIRLTESDLTRLVRRVIKEQEKDALFGGPNRKFYLETGKVSECLERDGWNVTTDGSGIMTAKKTLPYGGGKYLGLVKSTSEPGKFDLLFQYKPLPGQKELPNVERQLVVDLKTMNSPVRLCKYVTENAMFPYSERQKLGVPY